MERTTYSSRLKPYHFILCLVGFYFLTLTIVEIQARQLPASGMEPIALSDSLSHERLNFVLFSDGDATGSRLMRKNLQTLANDGKVDIHLVEYDLSKNEECLSHYRITGTPTLLVIDTQENVVTQALGVVSAKNLERIYHKTAQP